ncbi:hypothetical protein [Streptomyces coelicoflavus]|uniref:hypothetical protein n=1 Tax=Streptomyces coelicoflavus TaxID=285562 RepID=UPI003F49EA3A
MDTAPASKAAPRRRILVGTVLTTALAAAAGAGYWWYERGLPSQASAADCRLAQRISAEAHEVASGSSRDAEDWARETATVRRSRMRDGYLGFRVAQYESWAVLTAQDSPRTPSAEDVRSLQDKARRHCTRSGVEVSMPPLGS